MTKQWANFFMDDIKFQFLKSDSKFPHLKTSSIQKALHESASLVLVFFPTNAHAVFDVVINDEIQLLAIRSIK